MPRKSSTSDPDFRRIPRRIEMLLVTRRRNHLAAQAQTIERPTTTIHFDGRTSGRRPQSRCQKKAPADETDAQAMWNPNDKCFKGAGIGRKDCHTGRNGSGSEWVKWPKARGRADDLLPYGVLLRDPYFAASSNSLSVRSNLPMSQASFRKAPRRRRCRSGAGCRSRRTRLAP